jgi:hypothetical protein
VSSSWWTGVPAAESVVVCGPEPHRLRWDAGQLTPLDHPDPVAEAVLADLGGDEPPCLALLRHWAAHRSDARVLTLAGRHPGDTLGVGPADVVRVRALLDQDNARLSTLARVDGARASEARRRADEHHLGLIELLALDPSIGRRLQSEVAHNLVRAGSDADLVVIEAATVGRLTPMARRWGGGDRLPTVVLGHQPSAGLEDGVVTITVRPTWLSEIWGRYLGVVDHFLVLDVVRIVEDRAEVTAVAAPGGDPVRLTLRGPAPWHVERRHDTP